MPRSRALLLVALAASLVAVAAPAAAQGRHHRYGGDHQLRVWLGLFEPQADSAYWDENFDVFTGDQGDFEDVQFGVDYKLPLSERFGILFSGSIYESQADLDYRDFVDGFGDPIVHTTTFDVATATAALVLDLAPDGAAVVPYLGAGGGFYAWSLEESGDFIDFFPVDPEIFSATFDDDGAVLGWFALAGVEFPLGPQWSFFVEGRWHEVDDELSGDFDDLGDIDLGGRTLAGGFAWRF